MPNNKTYRYFLKIVVNQYDDLLPADIVNKCNAMVLRNVAIESEINMC